MKTIELRVWCRVCVEKPENKREVSITFLMMSRWTWYTFNRVVLLLAGVRFFAILDSWNATAYIFSKPIHFPFNIRYVPVVVVCFSINI